MADNFAKALDFTITDMNSEFLLGAAFGNLHYYREFKEKPTSPQALYASIMQQIMTIERTETFKVGLLLGFFAASAGVKRLRWLGTDDEHRAALYRGLIERQPRSRQGKRAVGPSHAPQKGDEQ